MPAHIIQLALCEGAKPKERVLLKPIKSRDDLDQLYCVLRDAIANDKNVVVEVWVDYEENS